LRPFLDRGAVSFDDTKNWIGYVTRSTRDRCDSC
jgi:hypothetical protein